MLRAIRHRLFWRIGVFLFIFAPIVNVGIGAYGDTLSLLCLFFILGYFYSSFFRPAVLLPEARNLALILILTIGYGLWGSLFFSSEPGSLQVILRPLRALIMFWGIYAFVLTYAERFEGSFGAFLIYDVFLAISFHSLIMIAEFLFPDLRSAIYPYTFADQADPYNQMFRMAGLTNGGGAQLSIFQSFGLLLWPLVLANHPRFHERVINTSLAVCIFVSLVLSARSGIVLAIVMLPIVVYFSNRMRSLFGIVSLSVKTLIFFALVGTAIYLLIPSGMLDKVDWAYAETATNRSLDFLLSDIRLSDREDIQSMEGMLTVPDNIKTLLVGDPFLFDASYLMGDRIVQSDIGYVIFLYGYGVLGSLLQYAFYLLILWYAVKYRRFDKQLSLISIIWAIAILGFHAKEVLVFSRIGFSLTLFFLIALAIKKKRSLA